MPKYQEVVIAGSYDLARGFVTGYLSGRSFPIPAVFSHECGIQRMSLGERMLTWAGVHAHAAHLIVDEEAAGDLIRESTTDEAGLGLKILSNRRIRSAGFSFHFRVYARVYAEEIKTILKEVPSGVAVRYKQGPSESLEKDGRGIEMYAPEHEYEYSAKGSVEGEFASILPFFRKMVEHPLVEVGEIHLEYEQ